MRRREFMEKGSAGLGAFAFTDIFGFFGGSDTHEGMATSGGMGVEEANYFIDQRKENNTIPAVRPEILQNPRAVFIIETHVDARKDRNGFYSGAVDQLHDEGNRVARALFVKGGRKGGSTFIKPNFTGVPEHHYNRTNGVYSAPDFITGVVQHLRDIGNTNIACGDGPIDAINHRLAGVYDAFDPYEIMMIEAGYERWEHFDKDYINWTNVENSPIWKEIPHYKPIMEDDNFLINIATMKCHLTALTTLTCKNLQGCVPRGYGQFCWSAPEIERQSDVAGIDRGKFRDDYFERIQASFLKHRAANFKRWEENTSHNGSYRRFEEIGGLERWKKVRDDREGRGEFIDEVGNLMRQEAWIHRGLDNAHTLQPDLNIIEGIIGMDGNEHNWWEIGQDHLVNMVVAGCSPFEVDAVGNWIMGHDPTEIWYTRVAKEKGYGENDINNIDIYFIRENGDIEPVGDISRIKRYPLGLNWARSDDPDQRLFW